MDVDVDRACFILMQGFANLHKIVLILLSAFDLLEIKIAINVQNIWKISQYRIKGLWHSYFISL